MRGRSTKARATQRNTTYEIIEQGRIKHPALRDHIAEEAERREREKQRKSALRNCNSSKAHK